jgi:hypothetical protein
MIRYRVRSVPVVERSGTRRRLVVTSTEEESVD